MGALACRDEVESLEHRCERVRNQLVALEVPLAHPKREQHVRVMRRAMGDELIARCTKSMTDTQRDCVLGATDSKVAFACIHTKGPRGLGRSE